jgi:hypothetical protein
MTYKQTMTINKTWVHHANVGFSLSGLVARLTSALSQQIPVGYQDETGFHTGVKAENKDSKWPTTW